MTLEWKIIAALAVAIGILVIICMFLLRRLGEVSFAKRSLSSKYGKTVEQFMPFLVDYPYDPSNFRFLGTPIDGVQFEDNKIIFIEFKSGESKLSERQRRARELISKKRVDFEEFRLG